MKKVRILFLDIDGVLNCSGFGCESYRLDFNGRKVPLNDFNLTNLERIMRSSDDIRVVWTTSWRFDECPVFKDWANPRLHLETLEYMNGRIVGITPKRLTSGRHDEILMWLNENEGKRGTEGFVDISNFAILDDTVWGMNLFKDHYFKVYPNFGLTEDVANSVISYLKTDHYDPSSWYPKFDVDFTD